MLKYFIELPATDTYVKSVLQDTDNVAEAKKFSSLKHVKNFIKNYCSGIYTNIRIYIEGGYDCCVA